jgi:hypothetical protein
LVAVHELTHYASNHDSGEVGLMAGEEMRELNEAITEIVTYVIARDHLNKLKSKLRGERDRNLDLSTMAYDQYTLIVKQIFPKVSFEHFVDAMFNSEGIQRLSDAFDEAMGEEDALAKYGQKLRDLYMTAAERKAKE